jgi:hypothetical protein
VSGILQYEGIFNYTHASIESCPTVARPFSLKQPYMEFLCRTSMVTLQYSVLHDYMQGSPHSGNDSEAGASAGTFFPVFERSQLQMDLHDLRPAPRPLPVRIPDKMHRKRAKYLPMLL